MAHYIYSITTKEFLTCDLKTTGTDCTRNQLGGHCKNLDIR